MRKQKILSIIVLCTILITLTGCIKKTGDTVTNENNYKGENTTIVDETTTEEKNNELNDEEKVEEETEDEVSQDEISQDEIEDKDATNNKGTYEYESKLDKFSIQVPNDWSFAENEYGFSVIVYTPDDGGVRENLGVLIQTPQINTNLEEYYQESIKKIDEISEGFKEIKTSDIEINGLKGKNTIYETIQNDTNIKSQQTVFIKDNIVYVIQYTATKETFDKYINDVNNIIKSFTLKN